MLPASSNADSVESTRSHASRLAASPLRVLIAESDPAVRAMLASMLAARGHVMAAETETGAEAVARVLELVPDIALLDVHMADMSGIRAAKEMRRAESPTAAVLMSADHELELDDADAHATNAVAVLAKPVRAGLLDATLRLAASRMRERTSAQAEVLAARRMLEERKLIERAKGILMRRTGSTEAEAYRILQRSSQDRSVSMAEIARAVLASEPGTPG